MIETHASFTGPIDRWRLCPSTHCERAQECRSPHDCSGTGKRRDGHSALHWDKGAKALKTVDPHPDTRRSVVCDCIGKFNEHLKDFNTKIEMPLWTASGLLSPFIQTIKLDDRKRGKPKSVMASHCPFCGEKYETTSPAPKFSGGTCSGGE